MTESAWVGKKLQELQKQCNLTQEKVANDLFISQSYLRLIEHGWANPSVNMVDKIYRYLTAELARQQEKAEETKQTAMI